jgi:hypothetical protein
MSKNDGGPAFPVAADPPYTNANGDVIYGETGQSGMTLRDWFAGKALTSGVADANASNDQWRAKGVKTRITPDDVAVTAYQYADAMIAARDRGAE